MSGGFLRTERDGRLMIWWLDQPGERHNKLSTAALSDIERALDEASDDASVEAIVVISAKPNSFIVGADVRELQSIESREDAAALSRKGHALIRRVQSLGKPLVAAMHGPVMGGGLEFALACTMRIASDASSTKFALPEVQLGLLPGGGGTQLLPRLVGVQQALPLLLTGKNTYPRPAAKMGLVDRLIHRPGLLHAAKEAARTLLESDANGSRRGPTSLAEKVLESNRVTRRIIYSKAADRAEKETRGNYPAPAKVIACVRTGIEEGLEAGLRAEEEHFAELAVSSEARELIRLFFAKNEAEKNPYAGKERRVGHIGVLGAGLMGSGIAQISAENGIDVTVKDQSLDLAVNARQAVYAAADKMRKKGALNAFERDVVVERVRASDTYDTFEDVDLIIEAAPEDPDLKQQLIREVEPKTSSECIFASNTSSIPISTLAEASSRPELLIGMHYFSPVPKVPLLEVIRKVDTPEWVLATAVDAGIRQGKTVIVVNDGPGFYTTRVLASYMNEALNILNDGADITPVDEMMRDFGFPMGPYELFDLVGIEVASKITAVLEEFFTSRGFKPNRRASRLVDAGFRGRKTGSGFYLYEKGRKKDVNLDAYDAFDRTNASNLSSDLIRERLVLSFVNEAVFCLEDGVLDTAEVGDVGAVFGLGFPPFRGGPFRYVDDRGASAILDKLEALREIYGEQFAPAAVLRSHARDDRRFTR